jgi:hypothetical protein
VKSALYFQCLDHVASIIVNASGSREILGNRSPIISAKPVGATLTSQLSMRAGERSGLGTRIVTRERISWCTRITRLAAFVELESAIRACEEFSGSGTVSRKRFILDRSSISDIRFFRHRKLTGRKPLTVCIAALCDFKTTIFGACDRMMTSGDIEFEPELPEMPKPPAVYVWEHANPKIYVVTSSICVYDGGRFRFANRNNG